MKKVGIGKHISGYKLSVSVINHSVNQKMWGEGVEERAARQSDFDNKDGRNHSVAPIFIFAKF